MRAIIYTFLLLPFLLIGQENPVKDLSFNNNNTGFVKTDIWGNDEAHAVLVQPDKKIIVGGHTSQGNFGNASYAIVRYNEDGSLDSSFGDEGIVTSDGGRCYSMELLNNGKIIIAGQYNAKNFVARLLPNGSLDETFGEDGVFNMGSNYTQVNDMIILPNGSILCAGHSGFSSRKLQVFKLTSDGELDTSFGTDGFFTSFFGYTAVTVNAILLQPDGKFIVGGAVIPDHYYPHLNNELLLVRFNTDGTLDADFGQDGVQLHTSSTKCANDLAFTSDYKIIAVGNIDTNLSGTYGDVVVTQFNNDGSLDETFGTESGYTRISVDSYAEYARSVLISADGKIYLGGDYWDWGNYHLVIRFNADGTPDDTFGNNGIFETLIKAYFGGLDMAFTPDSKLVLVGYANFSNNFDFVTIRLILDTTGLSVEDNNLVSKIELYPNPVSDVVNIKGELFIDSVFVYDLTGKVVFSQNVSNYEVSLNISGLSSGTYITKIITNSGTKIVKLIKQ